MQYAYTSLRDVIGNVIRNTRVQDSSFIADIHEWLYEAMEQLETEFSLEGKVEDLSMHYHKAKLPCGLRYIDGVEYCGHRLTEGGGVRPPSRNRVINYTDNDIYQSNVGLQDYSGHTYYTATLDKVKNLPLNRDAYYYTDMGYINSSFADGPITIYYRGIAVDEDGFPMIPDNPNYKQALYWYCRAMMIGAGWKDTIFNYNQCLEQFEKIYAPRALGEIRMPSPEQMEHRVNTFVRFIPSSGYYDNFFSNSRPEGSFIL